MPTDPRTPILHKAFCLKEYQDKMDNAAEEFDEELMTDPRTQQCDHKCHKPECALNFWIPACPICGCPNKDYDPLRELPEWAKRFWEAEYD